ncbi:hypothetical protein HBI56_061220 [Parastagonospora nodorum]|nr:hypothetical protein HBH53_124530 [Parastagonospora nodorum]KAH4036172.1 hypothetical protein HBI09_083670 [Parastagonospora nodorum]KAH4064547.1 hypothetical protein HBH50_172440 [Parastagonospora nodorum]KAH4083730.1 hypothetical protein HBH48_170050 [Parastagonospora nodorum]KAH4163985.1 hypothetical protein HBH43_149420 [Parastagonospora nodorum]
MDTTNDIMKRRNNTRGTTRLFDDSKRARSCVILRLYPRYPQNASLPCASVGFGL